MNIEEIAWVGVEVDGDLYRGALDYSQVNRNDEADLILARAGSNYTYTVHYRMESRAPQSIVP